MTKGKVSKAKGKKEAVSKPVPFDQIERFRLCPWPDSYLDAMAVAIRDWVSDPDLDAIKLAEFAHKHRIDYDTIIDHTADHEELRKAVNYAKSVLGAKREKMALQGKWNSSIVSMTMGMYDRDYKQYYEWKSKLAQKDTTTGNVTVVMTPFPSTDIVPEKKEKK